MWGVAKIFTSGHSKGGFDRTPQTPPGYGYAVHDHNILHTTSCTQHLALKFALKQQKLGQARKYNKGSSAKISCYHLSNT